MVAIATLLVSLTVTLLITRIGTVALMVTGLSRESARFQARSALTGVGFTTRESEKVTNHPVRRRVVMVLMLAGNAGFVTVLATLAASMVNMKLNEERWISNLSVLGLGVLVIWLIASSHRIDRWLSRVIYWALKRWTHLDVSDYVSLLHVAHGYSVSELAVEPGDWLVGQTLAESRLGNEGVLVLGIQRADGVYIGAPNADTEIRKNDLLTVYGTTERLAELDRRSAGPSGTEAHEQAMSKQQQIIAEEKKVDEEAAAEERDNGSG
jgi:hypothetical protein